MLRLKLSEKQVTIFFNVLSTCMYENVTKHVATRWMKKIVFGVKMHIIVTTRFKK